MQCRTGGGNAPTWPWATCAGLAAVRGTGATRGTPVAPWRLEATDWREAGRVTGGNTRWDSACGPPLQIPGRGTSGASKCPRGRLCRLHPPEVNGQLAETWQDNGSPRAVAAGIQPGLTMRDPCNARTRGLARCHVGRLSTYRWPGATCGILFSVSASSLASRRPITPWWPEANDRL